MSVISEEIRENIIHEFEEELGERAYEYDHSSIVEIFDEFALRKQSLLNLFSKHPNWDPEKLMIHFYADYSREFNSLSLYTFVNFIFRNVPTSEKVNKILDFIGNIKEQFFSSEMDLSEINSLNENFKLRDNMKSSKAIGKICREEGWDKIEGYNQAYAALCDSLNPIKVTRHTCISLNPLDYLLMSNGNSWNSCHYIDCADDDPGCYSSGTISYMLDECSFVFYTVDSSFEGKNIELQEKIQRQMFGYKEEVFVQSRLYPQSNDSGSEHIYTDIRNIVQKVISDCLEKPNLWVKSSNRVGDIVSKGEGATCYPDWNYSVYNASVSILKSRGTTEIPKIIMGAEPICIECGRRHDTTENINCCSCNDYCEKCGDRIPRGTGEYIDGYKYCDDCVCQCECCNEYYVDGEEYEARQIVRGRIETIYICSDCAKDRDRYVYCDSCDGIWDIEDCTYTEEGNWYCPDCTDKYGYCENCGAIHDIEYLEYDEADKVFYCTDCYEEIMESKETA